MNVLSGLQEEKKRGYQGGLYHKTQVLFAYNSNHIEGSRLTQDQTEQIFSAKSLIIHQEEPALIRTDDLIETQNHFRCFDHLLDHPTDELTVEYIKTLHRLLKRGTTMEDDPRYPVGEFKQVPNEVGGTDTTAPAEVAAAIQQLLERYSAEEKTMESLTEFHYRFEKIHPFADGNGRVGRLILFKECLANEITPFLMLDEYKAFYYRGLKEYLETPGFLLDTFRRMQDQYEFLLEKFGYQ